MHEKLKINKVMGYCQYHHIVTGRDEFFGLEFSVFIYLLLVSVPVAQFVQRRTRR